MTPTLKGRWQNRLILGLTVGALVALIFGVRYGDLAAVFGVLGYWLLLGLLWDVFYQRLQRRRWDGDWPAIFQLATGALEGAVLFWLISFLAARGLPTADGLPIVGTGLPLPRFVLFYVTLWLVTFLTMQGPLRILFPRWRFRGGEWWGR